MTTIKPSDPAPNLSGVWVDPDDAPPLTEALFGEADTYKGEKLVKRGRPRKLAPKQRVTLRLDPDLLATLKYTGPGWQSLANALLRRAMGLPDADNPNPAQSYFDVQG